MLLVRYRQDDAFDFGVREQRLEIGGGRYAELLLECRSLFLRPAVCGHDFQFVRFGSCPGEHLRPATETDDADFDGGRHAVFLLRNELRRADSRNTVLRYYTKVNGSPHRADTQACCTAAASGAGHIA